MSKILITTETLFRRRRTNDLFRQVIPTRVMRQRFTRELVDGRLVKLRLEKKDAEIRIWELLISRYKCYLEKET